MAERDEMLDAAKSNFSKDFMIGFIICSTAYQLESAIGACSCWAFLYMIEA